MTPTTLKTKTSKKGLLAKIRQRLGRRGVAMVEGAVIFPIMGGMLVLLELGHHSYDAYLTVGHVGQERTWSSATTGSLIGNCPGGRDDTSYADQVGGSGKYFTLTSAAPANSNSPGTPPPTGTVPVPGQQMAMASNGIWSHTDGATANVKVSRGSRSFANTPSSTDKVYCNQKYYGTLVEIIKNAI